MGKDVVRLQEMEAPMRRASAVVVSCFVAGISSAPEAWADVDALVQLTDLKVQLIDLDLSDGIDPQITFITPGDGFITGHNTIARDANLQIVDNAFAKTLFADLESTAQTVSSLAMTRSTADSMAAGGSASGHLGEFFYGNVFTLGESTTSFPFSFSLSGHTRLELSAHARVQATANNRCDLTCEYSFAEAAIRSVLDFFGAPVDVLTASVEGRGNDGALLQDSRLGTLSVNLTNDAEHPRGGNFTFEIRTQGATAVVPEPQIYALMLGGLAVMAGLVRARRRR